MTSSLTKTSPCATLSQEQHLREAVVAMLPPSHAGHSTAAVLRPADVAARTLLELVQLRRSEQQQQQQQSGAEGKLVMQS